VGSDASQARIDDGDDPFDRDGRFGHVGGEHDLPAIQRPHCPGLLLEGHLTVQGEDVGIAREGHLSQCGLRLADVRGTRKKDQDVSVRLLADQPPYGRRHLSRQRTIVGVGKVLDRDLEAPPLAANRPTGAAFTGEEFAHPRNLQGCGHRHQPQVRALGVAQAAKPSEG
jgi:hypothetical protein